MNPEAHGRFEQEIREEVRFWWECYKAATHDYGKSVSHFMESQKDQIIDRFVKKNSCPDDYTREMIRNTVEAAMREIEDEML